MSKANFLTAADVLDTWRDDVLTGTPPVLYPIGDGDLMRIEVGPGLVALFGGAPGVGKTAFTMQAAVDALRLTPTLRVLVCNVEMAPASLMDRQLARLSGIDLTSIRYRRLGAEHAGRIDQGINTLEAIADRLCFVRPPFDLANVAASADEFHASLILLDYIQRIAPPGRPADRRSSVDNCMNYLRQFADADVAVIVVSAVGRSKDSRGRNTYEDGLNLASFRESSELEFGADSAWLLLPDTTDALRERVTLRHLKDRHGELRDLVFSFDGAHQAFRAADNVADSRSLSDRVRALQPLWNNTTAATDDEEGER